MSTIKHIVHVIAGPTASGKSAAALDLARRKNGVIINCDSLQIYDGLSILTAQPTVDDLNAAPHRLYGALHPNDVCSAGHWRDMVVPVIRGVIDDGQTPIIVGGTGLYIKALMDGLSPMPDVPDDIRAAASAKQRAMGNPAFHAALKDIDPIMAARLHEHHTARLVRAYEVIKATGKSLAEWQDMPRKKPPADWDFHVQKIIPQRSILRNQCDARFDWMLSNGALEQVAAFQARIDANEVKPDVPLTKALGFKHLRDYLRGAMPLDEAAQKSKAQTRQYAKRQTTWLRHQI